jgi:hypothetical protein
MNTNTKSRSRNKNSPYILMKYTRKYTSNQFNKSRKNTSMNCSPAVKNKRVNESTCFTPEILVNIKNAYNKNHIEKIIELTQNHPINVDIISNTTENLRMYQDLNPQELMDLIYN